MLATAYPTLMHDFNIKASTVQWLSTGFMLVTGVMIPITAWMMNRFSSKKLYIIGMGLFFIGNIICFCANSFAMLLTGRIVSALGGGILTPLGQSIAMSIFPPEKRGDHHGNGRNRHWGCPCNWADPFQDGSSITLTGG